MSIGVPIRRQDRLVNPIGGLSSYIVLELGCPSRHRFQLPTHGRVVTVDYCPACAELDV